jgi:hypothetical protein
MRVTPAILAVVALHCPLPTAAESPAALAGEEAPLGVATRFARAFENRDFATVRALFAPGAMVTRLDLGAAGGPAVGRFTAEAWTDEAESSHVVLKEVRLEILDSTTQTLELGAVVCLRYRFAGKVGKRSFVSNGVDTYWLIRLGGAWRVLEYGYIEKLDFF